MPKKVFLYELLVAMAMDKFPYLSEKVVKLSIALMTRNPISTWAMWKSDFCMTHEEIIYICCDLLSFSFFAKKMLKKCKCMKRFVKWQQETKNRPLNSYIKSYISTRCICGFMSNLKSVNLQFNKVGRRDHHMIVPPSDGPMFILIDWE